MIDCAIIGCGRIAEDLHIPVLNALRDVRIRAVCDKDEKRLGIFSQKYAIEKKYNNVMDLLAENPDLDFIDVSTPGFTHYQICKDVINARINLLVEKPVTLSLPETLDLKERAHKNNIKVCVIQNYRYRNNVLKARQAFDQGLIGQVYQVNSAYHGQTVFSIPAPWVWKERVCKALIYELCIHSLDLQVSFAGPIKKLLYVKTEWNQDLDCTMKVYALVEYQNGATGIIDFQFCASSNYNHTEIFGSANDVLLKFGPEYFRCYSGRVNPIDELYYDCKRILDFAIPTVIEKIKKPKVKRRALSHYRLFEQFVRALNDESTPLPVSIDDVMPTMVLAEELSKAVYPQQPLSTENINGKVFNYNK